MKTILIIVILISLFVLFIYLYKSKRILLDSFEKGNTIVCGTKGKGKDLIFSYVIRKRKKEYYSNIHYNHKKSLQNDIKISDISIFPNTYQNFLNNEIVIVDKTLKENCDFYISDAGVYLPSQLDSTLHKVYPSLPLTYAIVRHLYNSNIHCNVQRADRLWKALREQADYFITATGTINLGIVLITTFRFYDKLESCCKDLRPLKMSISNEYQKALAEENRALNGTIKSGMIIQPIWTIKYDSRAFHKKVFGFAFKKEKKKLFNKRKRKFYIDL